MTAIVGTINRRGVAFAADSAATHTISSRHKITNHANKIFELSKYNPVGAAICGNLDFLGMPWEDIFKIYRNQLRNSSKPLLSDYSKDFFNFINQKIMPSLCDKQKSDLSFVINSFWEEILNLAQDDIKKIGNTVNDETLYSALLLRLDEFIDLYSIKDKCYGFEDYTLEKFVIYAEDIIDNTLKDCLSSSCPKNFKGKFISALFLIITSNIHVYLITTEIIIWGYGEDELFPSYESFVVSLAFDNKIKYTSKSKYVVSNENVACVEPFAQTDVANTVVRGIDADLRVQFYNTYKSSLNTFKDEIISKLQTANAPMELINIFHTLDVDAYTDVYIQNMNEYIQTNYIEKLVNTISYLSKEDLADMAESLVRMTYLKRRITSEEESVGGPVDVAVITKGDGFIWLKRKHYFSPELNHHYFER